MPEFCEWMMGFPLGWTAGASRTQRLKMLGNAVVPPQAAHALALLTGEQRMTWLCCDCRLVTDELADGRYCTRCRSGVLRDVTSEPRNSGANLTEGPDTSDAP